MVDNLLRTALPLPLRALATDFRLTRTLVVVLFFGIRLTLGLFDVMPDVVFLRLLA
jgi:hypothetical protein